MIETKRILEELLVKLMAEDGLDRTTDYPVAKASRLTMKLAMALDNTTAMERIFENLSKQATSIDGFEFEDEHFFADKLGPLAVALGHKYQDRARAIADSKAPNLFTRSQDDFFNNHQRVPATLLLGRQIELEQFLTKSMDSIWGTLSQFRDFDPYEGAIVPIAIRLNQKPLLSRMWSDFWTAVNNPNLGARRKMSLVAGVGLPLALAGKSWQQEKLLKKALGIKSHYRVDGMSRYTWAAAGARLAISLSDDEALDKLFAHAIRSYQNSDKKSPWMLLNVALPIAEAKNDVVRIEQIMTFADDFRTPWVIANGYSSEDHYRSEVLGTTLAAIGNDDKCSEALTTLIAGIEEANGALLKTFVARTELENFAIPMAEAVTLGAPKRQALAKTFEQLENPETTITLPRPGASFAAARTAVLTANPIAYAGGQGPRIAV